MGGVPELAHLGNDLLEVPQPISLGALRMASAWAMSLSSHSTSM